MKKYFKYALAFGIIKKAVILIFLLSNYSFAQSKKELKTINKAQKEITKEEDKFTGKLSWRSPIMGKGMNSFIPAPINISKVVEEGEVFYYIYLRAYALSTNYKEKGFTILFEDGSKIENLDAEVDVKVESGQYGLTYINQVLQVIGEDELEQLATKKIDAYRIYLTENPPIFNQKERLRVMGYARGILAAN